MPAAQEEAPEASDGEDSVDNDTRNAQGALDSDSDDDPMDDWGAMRTTRWTRSRRTRPAGGAAAKRKRGTSTQTDGKRKSRPKKNTKDPIEAKARRVRFIGRNILRELELRADIKMEVLNWVILQLEKADRDDLRALGALQQEH